METLANGADTYKNHGQSRRRRLFYWIWIKTLLIITVDMANELAATEALVDKRLHHEIGRAEQRVGRLVFSFLNIQDLFVVLVLVALG